MTSCSVTVSRLPGDSCAALAVGESPNTTQPSPAPSGALSNGVVAGEPAAKARLYRFPFLTDTLPSHRGVVHSHRRRQRRRGRFADPPQHEPTDCQAQCHADGPSPRGRQGSSRHCRPQRVRHMWKCVFSFQLHLSSNSLRASDV
jgi:hypothetical protein